MVVLFALLAAGSYGISDFAGGLASRMTKPATVLLYNYPLGGLAMVALLPLFPGHVSTATLLWSLAAGIAGLAGVGLMYYALSIAPMNIISPVTALSSSIVPVLVGVALGERPSPAAWTGIVLALLAVVLITRSPSEGEVARRVAYAPVIGLVAGVGFGLYFVFLARSGSDSGLWPVVIARFTSSAALIPLAFGLGAMARLHGRVLHLAVVAGILDALANLTFLLASRHGYLSVAGVITSLYPAGTVVLAIAVLKERTVLIQRLGLGLAVVAVALIAG